VPIQTLTEICEELLALFMFLELNAEAVRKTLKKHDKLLTSNALMGRYMSTRWVREWAGGGRNWS
jgi:SPX domain protein involved in polyphosphate accumulation